MVQFRGGGFDLEELTHNPDLNTGRAIKFKKKRQDRLLMSIAKGFGHLR